MNTTPFFCFPGSWSRVKSPLGLGEIFFHFFYSGVIKISCKISKIIQQIIIFKTNARSVQVIKNNQVVFRNLLSFSPGLLVNFFQNFLPILFKKSTSVSSGSCFGFSRGSQRILGGRVGGRATGFGFGKTFTSNSFLSLFLRNLFFPLAKAEEIVLGSIFKSFVAAAMLG